jgi:ABC-type Na+ efflux pump permease subunit
LQPSLDAVLQTVTAVNLEKWKRGTVRDETGGHITAIEHDLQGNLPPLLQAADANAGTLSKVLPVARNIEALYDVLVSVVEAARVSGPADQVTQLEQALSGLGSALRSLDDRVQEIAAAQELETIGLRKSVQTLTAAKIAAAAAPPPQAKPCPAPAPARKPRKKPPAGTPPATPPAAKPAS